MALYRLPQDGRESPASRQYAAQLRMIEPEQRALAPHPFLRCRLGVDLLVVAPEGGRERQLAEIVQGGGRDDRVRVGPAGAFCNRRGQSLDGEGMDAKVLGLRGPGIGRPKEVEGGTRVGNLRDRVRAEDSNCRTHACDRALGGPLVGGAQHRRRERRICLHGGHQLVDIAAVAGDRMQSPPRLLERRQAIDSLECRSRAGIGDTRLPTFGYRGSRHRLKTRSPGSGGRWGTQGLQVFVALLEWPCSEPAASFCYASYGGPSGSLQADFRANSVQLRRCCFRQTAPPPGRWRRRARR